MSDSKELELFEEFREKLILLTKKAIGYSDELSSDKIFRSCGEKVCEDLQYALHILQDNVLPASLFAQFQTGKSTTTVAMADGHEISPCGKGAGGLRTSTIPLTIYHDEFATQVKVNLFSKQELVKKIFEVAKAHIEEKKITDFDIDNSEDRKILMSAVQKEIDVYSASPQDYDTDRLSILRNAILTLLFYGCQAHKNLLAGQYKTISEIQPFLAFNLKLETAWKNLSQYGFNIVNQKDENGSPFFKEEECLHVFIDNIVIPIHSEFMSETGTAVIDAPGTMASSEDTARALKAASEAAVVLFILTGDKQLTEGDKDMLKKLHTAGMADKVLFIVNFHQNPDVIREEGIQDSILSSIEALGYKALHHKKLLYYNAFLAMRAAQGKLLLEGNMDNLTAQAIMDNAAKKHKKFTTLEEAWQTTTLSVLSAVDADECADDLHEKGLCPEVVKEIYEVSLWHEMIQKLREHVMSNRVAGILRDLGAQPVERALEKIETELVAQEKSANEDVAHATEEYEAAKALHKKFSVRADTLVADRFDSNIDYILAEDYYDEVVLGAVRSAAQDAAPKIFKATGLKANIVNIWRKIFGGATINEICHNIINNCYSSSLIQFGYSWSNGLERNDKYRHCIKDNVDRIQNELTRIWEELGLGENDLLETQEPTNKNLSGIISKDAAQSDIRKIIVNPTLGASDFVSRVIKGIVSGIGTFFAGGWIYVFVLPADFIIPGFGQLMLFISAAVGALVFALSRGAREAKIHDIEDKIASKLFSALAERKKGIIKEIIRGRPDEDPPQPGVFFLRQFYVDFFERQLNAQSQELQQTYEQKLVQLNMSREEREAIARKANTWRTQKITPLRQDVNKILEEITGIWTPGE